MRRSSDPEVRRNATTAVSIECLHETAARDAVSVSLDGVQQIIASPANGQLAKSMQSLRNNDSTMANGLENETSKEALELTPLTGSAGNLKASDSTVSLPNRVRYPKIDSTGVHIISCRV